jgi:cobalamin-dependent methionine synthase I
VERRLEHRIIDGTATGSRTTSTEAMAAGHTPWHRQRLPAGRHEDVGELFASGEMQLPFVLGRPRP